MHNEKKKIDWMEKKVKIEWDELQVEAQHLHDVHDANWYNEIVTIVKTHQDSSMGCEMNVPHNAFWWIEKDDNLAKAIWTSKVA